MPTYGYECGQCGHRFEVLQSIVDAPLKTCPKCAGPLHKLLYPVGVIFKGSGFYSTDYKGSSSNGKSAETGGESKPAGETKADTKSDNKPEGKSETKPDTKSDTKPATD